MTGPFGTGAFGTAVFSSSPLFTTKDLVDSILRGTGHSTPANETNKRLMVLEFINNRYARVSSSRHWDWLFQTLDSNLEAPYETGTIDLTSGSQDVVGVGTDFSANVVPHNVLIPDGRSERYMISAVVSSTEITLEAEYAGDTAADASFQIVRPIITLPADCEHVQSILVQGVGKLIPIGRQEMDRKQGSDPTRVGPPVWFTEVGRRTDGVRLVEVYPAPDKQYAMKLSYGVNIQKLEDSDDNYPLIPDRHRVVLYYGALSEMYRYMSEPEKASTAERDFASALLNMMNDTQLTDSRLIIQPSRNYRNRRANKQYRVFKDRFDFGRED